MVDGSDLIIMLLSPIGWGLAELGKKKKVVKIAVVASQQPEQRSTATTMLKLKYHVIGRGGRRGTPKYHFQSSGGRKVGQRNT